MILIQTRVKPIDLTTFYRLNNQRPDINRALIHPTCLPEHNNRRQSSTKTPGHDPNTRTLRWPCYQAHHLTPASITLPTSTGNPLSHTIGPTDRHTTSRPAHP
jgi:hypothetical protein